MENNILKKLLDLENSEKTSYSISKETGILLNTIIKIANFKKVLELGTFYGYSAIWIAEALKNTNGHLVTIEIDPIRADSARRSFSEVGLSNLITSIEGDAYGEISKIEEKFDLVFIDGGDDYLKIFNLVDSNLLRKNGLIAIDNAISPERVSKDVERVKQEMDKIGRYQTVTLNLGGGLLLALKTD